MKKVLKYIPGFRSGVTWKKVIASIYYILAVIFGLMMGFGYFLLAIGYFLLVCSIVDLILHKKKNMPIKQPIIAIVIAFALMVTGSSLPVEGLDTQTTKEPEEQVATTVEDEPEDIEEGEIDEIEELEVAEEPEEIVEEPKETLSQQNAVGKAKSYLDYTSFSKSGLVEQLEYEGFSNEDATYAVNKLDVNWKEQAVKKTNSYLDYTSFSRDGLIKQLEYEGFTTEEATYAVDQIGL